MNPISTLKQCNQFENDRAPERPMRTSSLRWDVFSKVVENSITHEDQQILVSWACSELKPDTDRRYHNLFSQHILPHLPRCKFLQPVLERYISILLPFEPQISLKNFELRYDIRDEKQADVESIFSELRKRKILPLLSSITLIAHIDNCTGDRTLAFVLEHLLRKDDEVTPFRLGELSPAILPRQFNIRLLPKEQGAQVSTRHCEQAYRAFWTLQKKDDCLKYFHINIFAGL
jgi:hypothetical protein